MMSPGLNRNVPIVAVQIVLLAVLLNACASQPQPVSSSLQAEPVAIEVPPALEVPPTAPVMQPEIKPEPAQAEKTHAVCPRRRHLDSAAAAGTGLL